jgi:transcriptional regulator with XRE-family HTH domain
MSSALFEILHQRYGSSETFVRTLKSRMKLHGVSQGRLAKRSGYHPTHLSRWMNSHVRPSLETMLKLDESLEQIIEGHS